MKHFSDDGCNTQPKYDYNLLHHKDDEVNIDYDKPIGGLHIEDWEVTDYDSGIKHFSDD